MAWGTYLGLGQRQPEEEAELDDGVKREPAHQLADHPRSIRARAGHDISAANGGVDDGCPHHLKQDAPCKHPANDTFNRRPRPNHAPVHQPTYDLLHGLGVIIWEVDRFV